MFRLNYSKKTEFGGIGNVKFDEKFLCLLFYTFTINLLRDMNVAVAIPAVRGGIAIRQACLDVAV